MQGKYKVNGPTTDEVGKAVIRALQTNRYKNVLIECIVTTVMNTELTDEDTVINTIKQLGNAKQVAISPMPSWRRDWTNKSYKSFKIPFKHRTIRLIRK